MVAWQDSWEALEIAGEFEKLRRELEPLRERLAPRGLAAYGRAAAMVRRADGVAFALSGLTDESLRSAPDVEALWLLIRSWEERQANRWDEALALAERAKAVSAHAGHRHLAADAEFTCGVCLGELGRRFVAVELYQSMLRDPGLAPFRRGVALSNLAYLLWDVGQTESLQRVLAAVPPGFRERLALMLSMVQGRLDLTRAYLEQGLPREVTGNQKPFLAYLLTEAVAVLAPGELDAVGQTTWLGRYWREFAADAPRFMAIASLCQQLLGLRPVEPFTMDADLFWREQLDCSFLHALVLCRYRPDEAQAFWRARINPILENYWLQTPLIPALGVAGLAPASPWADALARLMGLGLETVAKPLVEVGETSLTYRAPGGIERSVDLSQSPTSLKLLRVMAMAKSRTLTKRELHEQLTRCAYVATLHDQRLFKLLKRLEQRLGHAGIPALWRLPRDHSIQITHDIKTS